MVKTFYQDDYILQLNDKGFISLEFNVCLEKYYKIIEIDIEDLLLTFHVKNINELSLNNILSFKNINFDILYSYNDNFDNLILPSLFNYFNFNLYLDDKYEQIRFEFSNSILMEFNSIDDFKFICSQLKYNENIDDFNLKDKINIIKSFDKNDVKLLKELNDIKIPKENISINPCLLSDGTYNFELFVTKESFNFINSYYIIFVLKDINLNNNRLYNKFSNHEFIINNYLSELILNKNYNKNDEGVLVKTLNIKDEGINLYTLIILNSLGGKIWDC